MKSFMIATLCSLALTFPAAAVRADDVDTDKKATKQVVETAVSNVLSVLRNASHSREEKRHRVIEIIDPLIDFRLMARLTLGKKWNKLTPKQRRSFEQLFEETLKRSYFDKLTLFSDETVEFEEPVRKKTKGAPKYSVRTYIVSKGQKIRVTYALSQVKRSKKKESAPRRTWRVYDFEIEGISLKNSYRSQYRDFLRGASFDDLLKEMRRKIDVAKARESKSRGSKSRATSTRSKKE